MVDADRISPSIILEDSILEQKSSENIDSEVQFKSFMEQLEEKEAKIAEDKKVAAKADQLKKVQAEERAREIQEEQKAAEKERAQEQAKKEAEVATQAEPVAMAEAEKSTISNMTVVSTGYSSDGNDPNCPGFTTATGINLYSQPDVIAVDPSVIPLGTKVYIPELGKEYVAGDTGGAIGGSKIDIHFPSTTEALNWGRRTITIQIIT